MDYFLISTTEDCSNATVMSIKTSKVVEVKREMTN